MKMKITNEIKAKVFGPYVGVRVDVSQTEWYVLNNEVGRIIKAVLVGFRLSENSVLLSLNHNLKGQNNGNTWLDYSVCKLILKPLSAITDEHAIELTKIGYGAEHSDLDVDYMKSVCESFTTENPYKFTWDEYQYLQSKGYDLPQYLLDGKTLQQAGLAIYE